MKLFAVDGRCNFSGIQIRRLRVKNGLSQEQLALRMQVLGYDVSQKTISRIETGKRVVADFELVYFSTVFHVSINYLLGLEDLE